jgi:hypothetical protein
MIECVPTCQSPANPAKYPPVSAGEHRRAKTEALRGIKPFVRAVG